MVLQLAHPTECASICGEIKNVNIDEVSRGLIVRTLFT
jgi:hypothetical protein